MFCAATVCDGDVEDSAFEDEGENGRLENSTIAIQKCKRLSWCSEGGRLYSHPMSTDKTLAPSFANKAAKGRPTTSDLTKNYMSLRPPRGLMPDVPVDDGDDLSSSSIAVFEHFVVHTQMLEHLHNGQRGTRQDRLDGAFWRCVEGGRVGFRRNGSRQM